MNWRRTIVGVIVGLMIFLAGCGVGHKLATELSLHPEYGRSWMFLPKGTTINGEPTVADGFYADRDAPVIMMTEEDLVNLIAVLREQIRNEHNPTLERTSE